MSDAINTIRLVGGRYDGDQDTVDALPPYLWAYPCRCEPLCDGIEGIHWIWGSGVEQQAASIDGAEEYRYSHAQSDAHVYVTRRHTTDPARRLREAISA